ncbi:MAG: cysteine--tRNA ligase [Candidatus Aenigmatarchaeota archaeon]
MLKLYNTMTRSMETFRPLHGNAARIYNCGPTVYNYPHIGNYRAYVAADILRRYLKYSGYDVTQVTNITDVDDKTIRDSQKAGIPLNQFTERYTKIFFDELKMLNIEKAEHYPRATEHISEMVALIKKLLDKGYAYKGEDGSVYFSIAKFKDYGKLSHLKAEELKIGASGVRVDEYGKENARDFVLWKAWTPEDGDVFWETEIGKGRPGWHIECSAMSTKYLGETLDIHMGGVDLIFPHHENEIAQSEAATGKQFSRFWVHNEHVLVDGEKMSKSKGNFYTLSDVLKKVPDPTAMRFVLMATHYRKQLNFTFGELETAKKTVERLNDFMARLDEVTATYGRDMLAEISEAEEKFKAAMDDDLSTPAAIAAVFDFVGKANYAMEGKAMSKDGAKKVRQTLLKFDKVLGILRQEKEVIPPEVKKLAQEREAARKKKDWATSDKLRNAIKDLGWIVEDTLTGFRLRKA